MIYNLFKYRELLKTSIHKEVRGKYKGSFLGVIWSFLNPLLMVAVYSIVFPLILRVKEEHYTVFLIVGLIPWTFFTGSITQGTISILHNANLIKKVYFPREILPISTVTSALVNFLITFVIILVMLLVSGIGFSYHIVLVPIVILIQYILQLGIVLVLSGINIYFRDTEYIMGVLLLILFYLTPVVYSISLIPLNYRWIFQLNPISHLITAYRDILYYQQWPDFNALFFVGLFSVISLVIAYYLFRKMERKFAELV